MEVVKESGDFKIFKKRSGRFAVKNNQGKWVNGADKVKILVDAGLIKAAIPKKEEPAPEPAKEEAPAAEEAPAEEAPAE